MNNSDFDTLLKQIRACTLCQAQLPLSARPILQAHPKAKILIAGQAPGLRTHQQNRPFDDASGKRLRSWLGVDEQQFYNPELFAIVPMGFCYPGKADSGDKAPDKRCAQQWRQPLLQQLSEVKLTLLLGQYAMRWHLDLADVLVTDQVKRWQEHLPSHLPLPHPSPRNNPWLSNNPWFEQLLIPELQRLVSELIKKAPNS